MTIAPLSPDVVASRALHARKRSYRTGLIDGDFFVLRHLQRFLHAAITEHVRLGSRVIDVGCGEQPWRRAVEARGGHYTGLDIVQNAQGTVDIVAPIAKVPASDASFDVVVCTEVLEHVSDSRAAMAELRRLCAAGGVVIVTTPFAYPLHEEPYDFVRLTPHQVRALADEVGLVPEQVRTTGNEVEALAVLWNSIWSRGLPRSLGILRLLLLVLTRVPANLLALGASGLLGGVLPQKTFLSVVAVLRRP